MKKVVFKVQFHCDGCRKKAKKVAAKTSGVESFEMQDEKIIMKGDVDPVYVAKALRKFGMAEIISIGPAKEGEDQSKKEKGKKKACMADIICIRPATEGEDQSKKEKGKKKACMADIISIGPATEREDQSKKEKGKGKDVSKKKNDHDRPVGGLIGADYGMPDYAKAYQVYNPQTKAMFSDEDPNACVIC